MVSTVLIVGSPVLVAQSTVNYDLSGDWGAATANWEGTLWVNGDVASFTGTIASLTVADGIIAGGLLFSAGSNVWLQGALTLTSPATLYASTDSSAYFNLAIGGAEGLTKSGGGYIILDSNNTYTGTTAIRAGYLLITDFSVNDGKSSLGNSTSAIVLGDTATVGGLAYTGAGDTVTRGFDVQAGGAALVLGSPDTLTFTGPISMAGNLLLSNAGAVVLNSTLSGGGTLSKNNPGDLTLGGTISVGGILITSDSGAKTFINTGAITTTADQFYASPVVLQSATTLTSTNAGSGVVYFAGQLDGAQSLTVAAKTLYFLGPVGATTPLASIAVTGANQFTYVAQGVTTSGAQSYRTVVGPSTVFTSTGAGTLTFGDVSSGSGPLVVNTAGTTVLNGVVSAQSVVTDAGGTTQINGGTVSTTGSQTYHDAVQLGASTVLSSGPTSQITVGSTLNGAFPLAVTDGQISFSGPVGGTTPLTSITVAPTALPALLNAAITTSAAQSYAGGATLGADVVLTGGAITLPTVDGSGHALTITNSAAGSAGAMANLSAFNKSGPGTFTLTGTNTYTGDTTVLAGTLKVAAAGALGATANLHVAGGATLDSNGYQLTFTHLDGGGSVDVGSAGAILRPAETAAFSVAFTGTGGLTVNGGGTAILDTGAHTYAGPTTLSSGTLQLAGTASLPAGTSVQLSEGATFDLSGRTATIGRLSGAGGTVLLPGGTLTVNPSNTTTFEGAITGAGGNLVKTGGGHLILNGYHTYTGVTTVTAGRLTVNGQLDSAVQVSGTGTFAGNSYIPALTVGAGGTLAPNLGDPTGADVPGVILAGPTTFAPGGKFDWQINRAVTDTFTHWDTVVADSLTITATADAPFVINLLSLKADDTAGPLTGFDPGQTYTWQLSTSTNGITGFAADKFAFNRNGFDAANSSVGGTFAVQLGNGGGYADSSLDIVYTAASAIPEPGTYAAVAGLAALALAAYRRRHPRSAAC